MGSTSGSSAPAGYRFPREVIAVAVRWYLRYALSYRDVEELLAERGIEVDHVTVYRWVQTFTAEFIDAARPARHAVGNRWFLDETYVKVAGRWIYLYRAVDQHGQVIDVLASRAFFARALQLGAAPVEVTTDRAPAYPRVVDEAAPTARHVTEPYANNAIEADQPTVGGCGRSQMAPASEMSPIAAATVTTTLGNEAPREPCRRRVALRKSGFTQLVQHAQRVLAGTGRLMSILALRHHTALCLRGRLAPSRSCEVTRPQIHDMWDYSRDG
jgi:transposase, IS6 family